MEKDEYARYQYVLENIKDIVWEMDGKMIFTFVSPTVKETTGYEPKDLIGKSILEFLTPESREQILTHWQHSINKRINRDNTEFQLYDVEFICRDGRIIWTEVSVKPVYNGTSFSGYIGSTRDISVKKKYENELRKSLEELKSMNSKLDELATIDMLTGAFNRRKFESFAQLAMEKAAREGTSFAILMFDIDHFKQINDILGHKAGDQILREITDLVRQALRASDLLFRWGGDEFVILLPEMIWQKALKTAERVRKTVELHPFGLHGQQVNISIGVGEYRLGEELDQLVSRVDDALLNAKTNGKNKVVVSM